MVMPRLAAYPRRFPASPGTCLPVRTEGVVVIPQLGFPVGSDL